MIQEEYVRFKTAELLKEAGFPQYEENGIGEGLTYDHGHLGNYLRTKYDDGDTLAAPTQSQAMRWLREKHSLHIGIDAYKRYGKPMYGWSVVSITEDFLISASDVMTTYEEAAEAGIQAACEYLIAKGAPQ